MLTKDETVSHTAPVLPLRRAALVAGSTAAAALLALLPSAPAPVTPGPPAAARVVTAPPVKLAAATRPAPALPALGAATAAAPAAVRSAALQRALGKVGAKYRYGAAGPNAFDCSGLVTWAFKGAGKSLPRTSRAMAGVGTPVSKGALQPGDLVFFYRPVSHVGIYVGNGKIVHASTSSSPVKISDMGRMPFSGARRV